MIISSISYKGGVGKTTVAQNLAVCYAHSGYKVCILDADDSQNSLMWSHNRGEQEPYIKVIPNHNHNTIARTIADLYEKDGYEIIVVDSPPSVHRIASKIILASHFILVPVSVTGAQDVATTEKFLEHYHDLMEEHQANVPMYFLVNNLQPHIKLHQAIVEELEEMGKEFNVPILQTRLNRRTAYGEASAQGLGVYEGGDVKAKEEVISLANEVLEIRDSIYAPVSH